MGEPHWDSKKGKPVAKKVTGDSVGPDLQGSSPPAGSNGAAPHGTPQSSAPAVESNDLLISNLPTGFTADALRAVIGQYGAVADCQIQPAGGADSGSAIVRMANSSQATWLVKNLNGNIA